jgi:hypothetical protein
MSMVAVITLIIAITIIIMIAAVGLRLRRGDPLHPPHLLLLTNKSLHHRPPNY